jgi:hypothetical protein
MSNFASKEKLFFLSALAIWPAGRANESNEE